MALRNLSNSMYVARLRYIQTIHEPQERRNPDTLVRYFIPMLLRFRTALLGEKALVKLRSDPFYYYLVARTRYYDHIISEAIADGVQRIVGVGCGSDTRAYRFKDELCGKGIKVLECDQAEFIGEKQRLTKRWRHFGHVEHLPIDLNEGQWPELETWLGDSRRKTLLFMEGVSPYVNEDAMGRFLRILSIRLGAGSHVAYDYKIRGVKDGFGRSGRTEIPFRLSDSRDDVKAFHAALGLRLEHMELSSELGMRLLPDLGGSAPLFEEDALLRLRTIGTEF